MKKLILCALLTSVPAFAQFQVFPQVANFVYYAQVDVSNQNQYSVNCSGMLHMYMASGIVDTQYYYETVFARGFSFRTYFPRRQGDRINFTNHSIYCR